MKHWNRYVLRNTHIGEVTLLFRWDVKPEDATRVVPRAWLTSLFGGWRLSPYNRLTLLSLHRELRSLNTLDTRASSDAEIVTDVVRALERGQIVALRSHADSTYLPVAITARRAEASETSGEPPFVPGDLDALFSIRVVDDVGAPIEGLELLLVGPKKEVLRRTTDAAGMARVTHSAAVVVSARVASLRQLREKLEPRWTRRHTPSVPEGPEVHVRPLDLEIEPVSLVANLPGTLVITPYLSCREIAGAHFGFARSFVQRDALPQLSRIAEMLLAEDANGDLSGRRAMIFGHSDLSGPDDLNKALAERRARAIHALFTHDAGAWEKLFSGSDDGPYWQERWDVWEAQHMLNALGVTGDSGLPLVENGARDQPTQQAIARFRTRDYASCPPEQTPLPASIFLGVDGRRELFLAYAKRVSRKPLPKESFLPIGPAGAAYMGCGEFNPLSLGASDAESRRAVVFVIDGASRFDLPCELGRTAPCKEVCGPVPTADTGKTVLYRCSVYRELASSCPCRGGADLGHDVILRFRMSAKSAAGLTHVFVLESDDLTIVKRRSLAKEHQVTGEGQLALHFEHVPDWHSYRMRCEEVDNPYLVFDFTPYEKLHELGRPEGLSRDPKVIEGFRKLKPDPPKPPPKKPGLDF